MQAIERPFDPNDLSQLENLTVVAGYIRGETFENITHQPPEIPEPVLTYIHSLQDTYGLSAEPDMSDLVVDMLNELLVEKKYTDPLYIRVAHDWLRALQYTIPTLEYQNKTYNTGTKDAVRAFQEDNDLPATSTIDLATEQALQQAFDDLTHVVKGTVHDASWQPIEGATIEVWEKTLRGTGVYLQGGTTNAQGSYEVTYHPPADAETGLLAEEVHLLVRIKDNEGTLLLEEVVYHAAPVAWVNYTVGDKPYTGESTYKELSNQLIPHLDGIALDQIEESEAHKDVTYLYKKTGIPLQKILKLHFAERVSKEITTVPASVFFAFFYQNVPSGLPGYLLPDTPAEWVTWSEDLTTKLVHAVAMMPAQLQEQALDQAIANNLIPLADQQNKNAILQKLDDLRLQHAQEKPLIAGRLSLNELLQATSIDAITKQNIAGEFAKNQRIDITTLQEWVGQNIITAAQQQEIEQELQLALLGTYDSTVIQNLRNAYDTEEYSAFVYKPSDFAKWTEEDWESLNPNPGSSVEGFLTRAVALAPTVAAIAALQRDPESHTLEQLSILANLVDNEQLLSLQGVAIEDYLDKNNLELSAPAVEELKLIQRVERLAPRADMAAILLGANIHSAYQANRQGKAQLEQVYLQAGVDPSLAPSYASHTANTASNTLASLVGVAASYGLLDGGGVTPAAVTSLPNLEDLFGNNDFCGCAHCRSVYSPAAYLTDLLHWLESKPGKVTGKTGLSLLLERRPDLEHILLNCKNANTPMPYIDLVCEVLEYVIEPVTSYKTRNTTWTAAELKARPEHRLDSVYERIAKLPIDADYVPYASYNGFNLWQSQVHLLLEKLGITSGQFVQLLKNYPSGQGYVEEGSAAFEIPSHEALAITTQHADVDALVNPNRKVSYLLHDHQLSYESLLMLLEGEYTNPNGDMAIEPEDSCDIDELLVSNMTQVELDRWWRFLRLWKYTNWTIWELDALIMHPKVGAGALNTFCLERLAVVQRLQKRLGVSAYELLGLMGSLDSKDRHNSSGELVPSFYESIFYHNLLEESQRAFFDKNNLTLQLNLASITPEQIAYIAQALSLTSSQIETLLTFPQQGQWGQVLPQRVHQLASAEQGLALLYAYAKLAQQLRLSIEELKGYLRMLVNIADPLSGLTPFETFLDHYDALQASGMNKEELLHFLSGTKLEGYTLTETQVHEWQDELYATLGEAYDKDMVSKQTQREVLYSLLEQSGTFENQEAIETFLEVLYQDANGRFTVTWGATERTDYINNDLPTLFAFADAAALAQLQANLDTTNGSIDDAITTLEVLLHRRLNSPTVINYLAELWDAPTALIAYLLSDEHPTLGRAARHRLMEATPTGNVNTVHAMGTAPIGPALPNPPAPPSFTSIYARLLKYVFWAEKWQLNAEDIQQLELAATTLPALEVATLPLANTNPLLYTPIPQVSEYLHAWQWVQFAQHYNIPVANLVEAIIALDDTGDMSDFLEAVGEWINWETNDLTLLHQHFQWTANTYTSQLGHWKHWHNTLQLMHQTGVSTAEVLGWLSIYDTDNPNYFAQQRLVAKQVSNAVREATQEGQWLTIQQEIQDQLRLKKRNALVAYARNYDHQGQRVYYSSNDLYHLYLIDPEMSACQMTSRIKQAISSVQLYVQRCRLGLEQDHIQVTQDHGWPQWQWMQYYRVWEANRKVFLYPENWIEPSLRDNKTELFKQLEDELLQQEITQENVELALQNYLVGLNGIANLEVMSIAHELTETENLTHFLARTKEHPTAYYYRKVDNATMQWTGWEKMPLEIQGDHPVLQVYNGKLHLFWLQIIEQPEEMVVAEGNFIDNTATATFNKKLKMNGQSTDVTPYKKIPSYKTMQLMWSILYQDGWSNAHLSKKKLIHPWPRPDYALHLRPRHKQNDLWVDIYVSASSEFNNHAFYNQFEDEYQTMTENRYRSTQTPTPWHSSSFVFDGYVRQVKLFGIDGAYWTKELDGAVTTSNPIEEWDTSAPLWIDGIIKVGPQVKLITNLGDFRLHYSPEKRQLINIIRDTITLHHQEDFINDVYIQKNTTTQNNELVVHVKIWLGHRYGDHYRTRTITAWNNVFAGGSATRPMITRTVTTNSTVDSMGTNYVKIQDLSSYDYVYHNYGKDAKDIEELSAGVLINGEIINKEQANDLPIPIDARYSHNRITANKKAVRGFIELMKDDDEHPVMPIMYAQTFKDNYYINIPMEQTYRQTEIGKYYTVQGADLHTFYVKNYSGYRLYHPFAREIQSALTSRGRAGLYERSLQQETAAYNVDPTYNIQDYLIAWGGLKNNLENISFENYDGYALYNWEVFFHVPFLIATELSKNQRFEEAMAWFHCIFNPLGIDAEDAPSDVSRYWITKPFFEHTTTDYLTQQIQSLLGGALSEQTQQAIDTWKNHPFQPHVVARMRPVAYQKAVVMKYIDNLLAWGDMLFRRETLESINQAGLMYILAAELLGERPKVLKGKNNPTELDYNTIQTDLNDYFSNAAVNENIVISTGMSTARTGGKALPEEEPVQLYSIAQNAQYFCIPHNEKLLGHWDLVEDRLFKIRHCMDIDGRIRQLPLFAPPIDPALLVNAQANGVDLNSVLQDLAMPKPHYKYRPLARLAVQFTSEVKSLGQSLLSALQSKDAEGMALLQSGNGLKILDATINIKQLQIEEAEENIRALEQSREAAQFRQAFYEERDYMNGGEKEAMDLNKGALTLNSIAAATQTIATVLHPIPKIEGLAGLLASIKTEIIDGSKLSNFFSLSTAILQQAASLDSQKANLTATKASYDRRQEEWDFQAELAARDLTQIEQQIAAAQVRLAIAQKDLDVHKKQIENAKTEQAYLKTKYTNQQLYSWMVGELSKIYRQAYDLAYDIARRTEKSLHYELGLPVETPSIIQHGYWDSLRKGLLAGDKLMLTINQLEDQYVQLNKRELELTKHISLHQWAPDALLQLKTTGKCQLQIPEWWFDIDYPGHYLRRIKALTISIPCVVGPHVNVNCKLTLNRHVVRRTSILKGAGYTDDLNLDERFDSHSIATSSGQNDAGVFELNFNDERFLPFEGLGAISTWELELPDYAQFDYETISDVVFHLRYTARDAGNIVATAAKTNVEEHLQVAASQEPMALLISAKDAFPTAWHKFKNPGDSQPYSLELALDQRHYPFFTSLLGTPNIVGGKIGVMRKKDSNAGVSITSITPPASGTVTLAAGMPAAITFDADTHYGVQNLDTVTSVGGVGTWSIEFNDATDIDEVYVLLQYKLPA